MSRYTSDIFQLQTGPQNLKVNNMLRQLTRGEPALWPTSVERMQISADKVPTNNYKMSNFILAASNIRQLPLPVLCETMNYSEPMNYIEHRLERISSAPHDEVPYDFSMGSSHSDTGESTNGLSSPETGMVNHQNDLTREAYNRSSVKSPNMPDLCQVCKGVAGKHQAYGGKVCHSCRAFFRRSVQTKYYEIFSCTASGKCDINSSTRKNCKYCRFKKCLQAKMQISWVLSEQERERRFNKLKKVTFRNDIAAQEKFTESPLATPPDPMPSFIATLPKSPEIYFTIEEQLRLESLRDYIKAMAIPRFDYFFDCEPDCLLHLANATYFGGPLNYEMWKRFTNASDLFTQEMLMNLDGMKELTVSDALALIKSNGLASYCYMESVYADEEDSGLCQSLKTVTLSGQYPPMRNLLDILQRLNMTDKNPILHYNQIYTSPWCEKVEDEERHKYLIYKMKEFGRPPIGTSDQILTALMRIIVAFTPDFVVLQQRDVCEKILNQYCMMLHRYIKKTYGIHSNAKFAQAMATCVNAREAAQILKRRNSNVLQKLENSPR